MRRARTLHILSIASACGGLACVGASFGASLVARAAPPAALVKSAAGAAWGGIALLAAAGGCEWAAAAVRRRRDDRRERQLRETEAKLRELAVRLALATAEREHAQAVLYSISDAVLVTGSRDDVVLANESAARAFEFDPSDVARSDRTPVGRLLNDPQIARLIRDVRAGGAAAGPQVVEHHVETPSGRRTYKVTLAPLGTATGAAGTTPASDPPAAANWVDTAGTAATSDLDPYNLGAGPATVAGAAGRPGVVVVLRDVTGEKDVSEMKNDFVSLVSHELRTPLASIKAYIEMLIDGEAVDEQTTREFYNVIQHEANRLSRLIDNILSIARIESGLVRPNLRPQPLAPVLREAAEIIAPQAAQKGVRLVADLPPDGFRVLADKDMLYQAALNLLSNAVKFTAEGGTVTLRAEATDQAMAGCRAAAAGGTGGAGGKFVIRVSDTGAGIPEKDLPFVFDKFYRAEAHTPIARGPSGTGLGLSLAKHIVETVHGGRIFVESEVGKGSCFGFELDQYNEANDTPEDRPGVPTGTPSDQSDRSPGIVADRGDPEGNARGEPVHVAAGGEVAGA